MFADVAGSMDLAEQLDAEEWAAQMDGLFSTCAEAVTSAGGTVDKFTGDGIMAVFGAPVAQEDHARRVCVAALRLQSAATDLKLPVRVGINSGEVVSGTVGGESLGERTALGHTVGLAQRMESLAEVGGICLSEVTARLVAAHFELRDRGDQAVKGSREPVGTYALIGPRTVARPAAGSATPFVGREVEFAVLEDALARAEAGQAQVVGVVGEAGVGKSRLGEEFASACAARMITVRRTAGLSHATDVALLPVISLLRDAFGVTDADEPATAREQIGERLTALDPDLVDALPLLFDFLEVPDHGSNRRCPGRQPRSLRARMSWPRAGHASGRFAVCGLHPCLCRSGR
jgi:adenylate cyclase